MKAVKVIIAIALLLGLGGYAAYRALIVPQLEFAEVATAFAAKKACSCIHVVGRSLEECKTDFTDDVSMARFNSDERSVTVDVLNGRISARVIHTPGLGCALLPSGVEAL